MAFSNSDPLDKSLESLQKWRAPRLSEDSDRNQGWSRRIVVALYRSSAAPAARDIVQSGHRKFPSLRVAPFRLTLFSGIDSPSQTDSRRDSFRIGNLILCFNASAIGEGNIRTDLPLILRVESQVPVSVFRRRLPRHNGKLRWTQSRRCTNLSCRHSICNSLLHSLINLQAGIGHAIGITSLRITRRQGHRIHRLCAKNKAPIEAAICNIYIFCGAEASTELEKVLTQNHGCVVLKLVLILHVVRISRVVSASGKRAVNVDRWRQV